MRVPVTPLCPVPAAASGEKIIADVNHKAGRHLSKGSGKPHHGPPPLPWDPSQCPAELLSWLSSPRERGFSSPLRAAFIFAFRAQIPRPH